MGKFRGHYVNMEKRETFSHSPRPRMWSSGRRRKVALDRVTDVSEHLGSGNSSGRRRSQSDGRGGIAQPTIRTMQCVDFTD